MSARMRFLVEPRTKEESQWQFKCIIAFAAAWDDWASGKTLLIPDLPEGVDHRMVEVHIDWPFMDNTLRACVEEAQPRTGYEVLCRKSPGTRHSTEGGHIHEPR